MTRRSCLALCLLVGSSLSAVGQEPKSKEGAAKQSAVASASSSEKATEKDEIRLWPCEKKLIELTNAERARYGLGPLTLEKGLLDSARTHCYWMADVRSLQHTTAAVAENIAMGQGSCTEAVADWMRSPGHRANMLGRYSRIGAAAYTAADGRIYWCLQFLP